MPNTRPIKSITLNLLLLTSSIFLALGICELCIRYLLPQFNPQKLLVFDNKISDNVALGTPNSIQRHRKNTGDFDVEIRFNSSGLRDKLLPSSLTEQGILVTGDSFTFGFGVKEEERFSDLARQKTGINLVNASAPTDILGYKDLLAYTKSLGAKPKTLIVGICMENDIKDYSKANEKLQPSGKAQKSWFFPIKVFATNNLAIYNLFTAIVHTNDTAKQVAIKLGVLTPNLDGIYNTIYNSAAIESTANQIDELLSTTNNNLVLIIPSRRLWIGKSQEREAALNIHKHLIATLMKNPNLKVIDTKKAMEDSGNPLQFHFANDGHWNASGHELAASLLISEINHRQQEGSIQ